MRVLLLSTHTRLCADCGVANNSNTYTTNNNTTTTTTATATATATTTTTTATTTTTNHNASNNNINNDNNHGSSRSLPSFVSCGRIAWGLQLGLHPKSFTLLGFFLYTSILVFLLPFSLYLFTWTPPKVPFSRLT